MAFDNQVANDTVEETLKESELVPVPPGKEFPNGEGNLAQPPVDCVCVLGQGVALNMRPGDVPIQFVDAEGEFVTGWQWIETPSPLAPALVWLHAEMPRGGVQGQSACRTLRRCRRISITCSAYVTSDYSLPPFPIPFGEREPPLLTVGRGGLGVEILTTYTCRGGGGFTFVANRPSQHARIRFGKSSGFDVSDYCTLTSLSCSSRAAPSPRVCTTPSVCASETTTGTL